MQITETKMSERVSYGLYFFGQGLIYTLVAQYLMMYYTDYALLPPLVISVILFAGKLWDAVNDTLFGLLMDRIRFKNNKRFKPWLKICSFAIPIATILMFSVDMVPNLTLRIVLAALTYVIWDLAYTMSDAPVLALATSMTTNVKERGTLMTFSGVGGATAMALSAIVLVPIFDSAGFFTACILIGIVTFCTMSAVSITCKERHNVNAEASQQSAGLRETIQYLKANHYLLLYYGYRIVSGAISASMLTFMAKWCLGDIKYVSVVALISIPLIICVYIASPFLLKRFDKIVLYRTCAILSVIVQLTTYFSGYQNKTAVIILMAVIAAISILPGIMMGAIPQDCVEYGTFKTGIRKEGITFSLQSFVAKFSAACASAIGGIVLHIISYDGSLEVQAPETIQGIWNACFLLPAVGFCLSIGFLFAYKLRDCDVQLMSDANCGKITKEEALAGFSRQYK